MLRAVLARPLDEDDERREPPFNWHTDAKTDRCADLVAEFSRKSGSRYYELAADVVEPGRTLFAEARPLLALSLQERERFDETAAHFDAERTLHYRSARDADSRRATLPHSYEWFMTFELLERKHSLEELALRMPTAGVESRVELAANAKLRLEPLDVAWIGAIRKAFPSVSYKHALRLYGIVCVNVLYMRSPLTSVMYGLALYDEASSIEHSCAPSARVHFEAGGALRLVSTGPLANGTRLTINRYLPPSHFVSSLAIAPERFRRHVQALVGRACRCSACRAKYDELRGNGTRADATLVCDTVEAMWSAGFDADLTALGLDRSTLSSALDVYACDRPTELVCERIGGERLRTLWASTSAEASLLPLELALLTLRLSFISPIYIEQRLGATTTAAARDFVLGDGGRLAAMTALRRQNARDGALAQHLGAFAASAHVLAYASLVLGQLFAVATDDPGGRFGHLTPTDDDRARCQRMELALMRYVHGSAPMTFESMQLPTMRTAVQRVVDAIIFENPFFVDALRFAVAER